MDGHAVGTRHRFDDMRFERVRAAAGAEASGDLLVLMGVSKASEAFSHRRPVVLAPGRVLQVELRRPVCSCLYLVFHAFCSAEEDNVFNVVERVFRVRQGRWKRRLFDA